MPVDFITSQASGMRIALIIAMALSLGMVQAGSDKTSDTSANSGDPVQFRVGSVMWQQFSDPASKMTYYHNTESGKVQWEDPRDPLSGRGYSYSSAGSGKAGEARPEDPEAAAETKTVQLQILFTIFVLVVSASAGRIYYLKTNFPEMLNPTKKRKERAKGWGKYKGPRGSNKMSQDGKGESV
ncbi:hypothetical protein CYMTET_21784 [Cymbomonas tetramitiformis]|uniref:WW domain-containing protein n=1 Tax=Cymbomonas tetramitiformis TaxID=36881 RepID=A0AAE0G1P9_9CHLO|nr:hypothetical protein CYMTET_21784 [Cymbomonas tetramitiformis]